MLYAIATVLILILDQGLKYWTSLNLELNNGVKDLIPGLIRLTNVHNYGAAFSILQEKRWFLITITCIFSIVVIVMIGTKYIKGRFGRWTAIMILGGALGNGIDRMLYGYVVDMLEFEFFTFPVFNIADVFICVGGVLFCLYVILNKDPVGSLAPKKTPRTPVEKQRPGADIRQVQKPILTKETATDPVLAAAAAAEAARAKAAAREAAREAEIMEKLKKEQKPSYSKPSYSKPSSDTEFSLEDILAEFSDK